MSPEKSPARPFLVRLWRAARRVWLRPELRHALADMADGTEDRLPTMNAAPVIRLLEAGADPNTRDIKGNSVLHIAMRCDALELAAAVLKAGGDPGIYGPSIGGFRNQPWQEARSEGMACLLLAQGSPMKLWPGQVVKVRSPALMFADLGWKIALEQVLQAHPEEWPVGTLADLASTGSLKPGIATIAVAHGADPNSLPSQGVGALHWAAWRGNASLVDELLTLGADPQQRTVGGRTVLEFVADRKRTWANVPEEQRIRAGEPEGENKALPQVERAALQATLPAAASPARRPRM